MTVLLAAASALPAPASARTLDVHGAPFWHGKVVNIGGLGWGTAYGVCPAGPIEIRITRTNTADSWQVGTVPSTSVIPFSGGFSTDIRLLPSRVAGTSQLVLTQTEREYDLRTGCGPPRHTRFVREIAIQRPPPDAPCTRGTDCVSPEPHLSISRVRGGLPSGASLPPPASPCPPTGCEKGGATASLFSFDPGAEAWLQGSGFPGVLTPEQGCQDRSSGAVTFALIDRSGTGFPLGLGDSGEPGSSWNLDDGGTFQGPVRVVLPARGLAYGRAAITAVRTGFEGDPVCGQVASAPLTISRARRTVSLETTAVAGAGVVVNGVNWGTDECDGKVEVIESRGKAERVLAEISPGGLGAFRAEVNVKSLGGSGEIEITASQESGLEIADERGRPSKAKCLRMPRVTKDFESGEAQVIPPSTPSETPTPPPDPTPPEPPPPPPPAVPTVSVTFSTPSNLHVTGGSWDTAACPSVPPVQIADTDPRLSQSIALGAITPDASGQIVADLQPQAAKAGDAITATQARCDGSTGTATTNIG